jgi:hypothetical protein
LAGMPFAVSFTTQSYAVGYVMTKVRVLCKRLDMMSMKIDSFSLSTTCAAVLTSVRVTLKDMLTPFLIFRQTTSATVGGGFWNQTPASIGSKTTLTYLFSGWFGDLGTLTRQRAIYTKPSFASIFWHGFVTDGAICLDVEARFADLIKHRCIRRAIAANLARNSNFSFASIGRSAAFAGRPFGNLSTTCNCGTQFSATTTRNRQSRMTFPAQDAIAPCSTDFAVPKSFCFRRAHCCNLPKLAA